MKFHGTREFQVARLQTVALVALLFLPLLAAAEDGRDGFTLVGLLHDDQALNRAHDIELRGNVAYVAGKGGSLALVDVSNPAEPKLLSSIVDPVALEDAETVLPMGDILLLGARDLLAIDVSDPRRPVIKKTVSDRPRIDRINGMARRGHHVFSANKSGFVAVFDVSDPTNPVLAGVLDTKQRGGLRSPHDIAVFGDHIIVPSAGNAGDLRTPHVNLAIYRVADAKTHQLLPADEWSVESVIEDNGKLEDNLSGANRVAVWQSGDHTYAGIGAFVCDRVGIIELTDPAKAAQIANMPVADIGATGMTVAGNILFVAGGECVEAIDITDPFNPVSIAQYRNGDLFPTRRFLLNDRPRYDNAHDLVYRDGHLYVTAQNDNQIGILKVLSPKVLALAKTAP